jgi:uncharacterized LabA/DUF88 family protein
MDVEDRKLALLIDADNISPIYMNIMLSEAKNYGTVSVRRIYGDWTSSGKNSWKSVMLDNSLTPIQQYSYTYGKNASDSAIIIDAMDSLYAGHVDGFILASSDSDFTRLAMRLREAGKFVIGMGESKTPSPFVKSCDEFKVLDIILKNSLSEEEEKKLAKATDGIAGGDGVSEPTPITKLSVIKKSMRDIIDKNSDENGQMHMSKLASMLTRLYSDFDARNYGKYGKFSNFVKALPEFEVTMHNTVAYVKRKDSTEPADDASEKAEGKAQGGTQGAKRGGSKAKTSKTRKKSKTNSGRSGKKKNAAPKNIEPKNAEA